MLSRLCVIGALASLAVGQNLCPVSNGVATCTYGFTGAEQTFTVPVGVTSLFITATGARGGNSINGQARGGQGGRVRTNYNVPLGTQTLFVNGAERIC